MGLILPLEPFSESVAKSAEAVREGGVALLPTDSCYGLSCRGDSEEALKRIRTLKGRDEDKPFLLLAPDAEYVEKVSHALSPDATLMMKIFWPGPLTLVTDLMMEPVEPCKFSAAFRVPKHEFLSALLKELGFPIVSTSANPSGSSSLPYTLEAVDKKIRGGVDIAIDGGTLPKNLPSTLVDVKFETHLLREGAIRKEELEKVLGREIPG